MEERFEIILTLLFGVCLRSIVAVYNYSGFKKGPINGDFEAQRHWMEITNNLSVKDWYKNTTDNDLLYWGLDYPPLTAYHSFIVGKVADFINPKWIELHRSRGIEDPFLKIFMRASVIFSDLIILFPSVLLFSRQMKRDYKSFFIFFTLISPSLILIDHGHFQYNNISLGLYIFSIYYLLNNRFLIASIFFVSSISYKQMELYHSLPVFFYILTTCFRMKFTHGFVRLTLVGITVLTSFSIIFAPFLTSLEDLSQVIARMFPIGRGIFEDKVANFWCTTNVILKWTRHFSKLELFQISTCLTLIMSLPACLILMLRPTKICFLYSSCAVSLAFFLFSFQVHEKTILIPLISSTLNFNQEPSVSLWFACASCLSMFPLMTKDDLIIPCIILIMIYVFYWISEFEKNSKKLSKSILQLNLLFLTINIFIISYFSLNSPPLKYPDLQSLLISVTAFSQFFFFYVYYQFKLFLILSIKTKTD